MKLQLELVANFLNQDFINMSLARDIKQRMDNRQILVNIRGASIGIKAEDNNNNVSILMANL